MSPTRLLAAVVVIVTIAVVAFAMTGFDSPDATAADAPERLTTTTGEPDLDALVTAGAVMALSEVEEALTDEALARSTSTTTTTATSSTPAPTTPPAAAPSSTEPFDASDETTAPTTAPPPPDPSGGLDSAAESEFASLINSYRTSQGKAPLTRDGSLDAYARAWAEQLSVNGYLSHSNIGSLLPPWSSVGENVAMGGSVGGMFDALVASSGHQANMLGDFTHLGVGVWQDDDGTYWTVHVFTS